MGAATPAQGLVDPGGELDPRPRFPPEPGGVAILGCGTIAQAAHLPAYGQYGVGVVGVWSRSPATTDGVRERFPFVEQVYGSAEELLADPRVRFVDIALPTAGRGRWVEAAVEAGKHVLVQKPLAGTPQDLAALAAVTERARAAGLRVAANQNGRWAPPWRLTTRLLRSGAIGDVVGVTHLHDKPLPPLVGTPFDDLEHMLLTDYLNHWIDITHGWLEPASVVTVQASDSRVPGQPAESRNPWSATINLTTDSGATATLRIAGNAVTSTPSAPFWVHGTDGTVRGSVLLDSDRLSLDRPAGTVDYDLPGAWFVDGFAGTMGELMCAVAEDREPENSATSAATTVRIMLAARESADRGGAPVAIPRPGAVT
jgi:predicted dehydrogenase